MPSFRLQQIQVDRAAFVDILNGHGQINIRRLERPVTFGHPFGDSYSDVVDAVSIGFFAVVVWVTIAISIVGPICRFFEVGRSVKPEFSTDNGKVAGVGAVARTSGCYSPGQGP